MYPEVPNYFKKFLTGREEDLFASRLIGYVVYNIYPCVSPAIWQDAMKAVRLKKRDVFALTAEESENAWYGITTYEVLYLIEHLGKQKILEILNELFNEKNQKTLDEIIEEKLHAPLDDLISVQEKRIVKKDDLKDFDELFKCLCWLDFDKEAREEIYKKILADELSDEQISYFLGASEKHEYYAELYPVVKHILKTTNNPQTFWTAGDVLNLIWIAAPEEANKKIQDDIFEIFLPRAGSAWAIANVGLIEENDGTLILRDSIGWLKSLDDLIERLPKLKDYGFTEEELNVGDIEERSTSLAAELEGILNDIQFIGSNELRAYFNLVEETRDKKDLARLKSVLDKMLKKLEKPDSKEGTRIAKHLKLGYEKAENSVKDFLRERKELGKLFGVKEELSKGEK